MTVRFVRASELYDVASGERTASYRVVINTDQCADCGRRVFPVDASRNDWVPELEPAGERARVWCPSCRDPATDPRPNETLDSWGESA